MGSKSALGDVIKKYRAISGLSQEELALSSGLHRTYISQIERGIKQPTLKNLHKIATALNIKLHQLVREYENAV